MRANYLLNSVHWMVVHFVLQPGQILIYFQQSKITLVQSHGSMSLKTLASPNEIDLLSDHN